MCARSRSSKGFVLLAAAACLAFRAGFRSLDWAGLAFAFAFASSWPSPSTLRVFFLLHPPFRVCLTVSSSAFHHLQRASSQFVREKPGQQTTAHTTTIQRNDHRLRVRYRLISREVDHLVARRGRPCWTCTCSSGNPIGQLHLHIKRPFHLPTKCAILAAVLPRISCLAVNSGCRNETRRSRYTIKFVLARILRP